MPAPKPKPLRKPKRLGEVQRLMSRVLMRPLTRQEGMQREWVDDTGMAEVANTFIKPNDRLSSFDRLQIYNQQYWWRLLSCFGDDFPGLRAVIGERKFDRLAVAYLEAHGSTCWSLRDLGQHLETFLAKHPKLASPRFALARDMVRVEWAKITAFDTAELPPIDPQQIARQQPERLRFRIQPFVALLELRYPVDHLLKRLRESNVETGSVSNAVSASRRHARKTLSARASRTPIYLAVHRVDFSVYYKRLDPEAFILLQALRDGATLADACGHAFARSKLSPEAASEKISEWFRIWTRLGWLCRWR
jgi:hypothetical protein